VVWFVGTVTAAKMATRYANVGIKDRVVQNAAWMDVLPNREVSVVSTPSYRLRAIRKSGISANVSMKQPHRYLFGTTDKSPSRGGREMKELPS